MSSRHGPPKHQNKYAWKPNAGRKINETEVGGRFRPLSEVTGVCPRCKDQIEWKRRYGKYKPLSEPAKCQSCFKRTVRQAYHNLCPGCAKEQGVCSKCRCQVGQIVGRDISEVEAEQKMLEEAIKNAPERERRSLLRAVKQLADFLNLCTFFKQNENMNKEKPKNSDKTATEKVNKVGELFPSATLEDYAELNRDYFEDEDDVDDGRVL